MNQSVLANMANKVSHVKGSESTFPHVKNKDKSERDCFCFHRGKIYKDDKSR